MPGLEDRGLDVFVQLSRTGSVTTPPSYGPQKASSARGQGLQPASGCGGGKLEPGSPAVIYGEPVMKQAGSK